MHPLYSLHDDPIARRQAFFDRPEIPQALACRDGARFDRPFLVDQIHRAHPLEFRNGPLGHQKHAAFLPGLDLHAAKDARQQRRLGIGKIEGDFQGAGLRIHRPIP